MTHHVAKSFETRLAVPLLADRCIVAFCLDVENGHQSSDISERGHHHQCHAEETCANKNQPARTAWWSFGATFTRDVPTSAFIKSSDPAPRALHVRSKKREMSLG